MSTGFDMRIAVTVGDPWELGEAVKWQPLLGEVIDSRQNSQGGQALIRLDEAVTFSGRDWKYLIASPRYQGATLADLQSGGKLIMAFLGVPDDQVSSGDPFDTSRWRGGGLAFTGGLARGRE